MTGDLDAAYRVVKTPPEMYLSTYRHVLNLAERTAVLLNDAGVWFDHSVRNKLVDTYVSFRAAETWIVMQGAHDWVLAIDGPGREQLWICRECSHSWNTLDGPLPTTTCSTLPEMPVQR